MNWSQIRKLFRYADTSQISDYFKTQRSLVVLKFIRVIANLAGRFTWMITMVFLFFLLLVIICIILGSWLTRLTGSIEAGYGIVAFLLLVLILMVTRFRRALFIDPVARALHQQIISNEESKKESH
jgi:hypothetical protein